MLTLAPIAALAATVAVSTTPSALNQYPIGVTRCAVVETQQTLPFDGVAPGYTTLDVSFVNHALVTAKDVRITVNYGGVSQTIDDRGTFSPNIAIEHNFGTAASAGEAPACSVAAVTFADGSTWQPQV
ncbi:MAG TPA: hypothetical protein VGN14_06905 [Candidatus Elarobacter sp.]|jgi:hypothetical protein